jgi:hypothetical protein
VIVRLPDLVVICPKLDEVMEALGEPVFGWFRMLYISARNCSFIPSRIGCQRLKTVSRPIVPGLRRFGSVRVLRSLRGVNVASVDAGIALQVSELALACSEHVKTSNARSLQFANFKTDENFILLGSPRSNPWSGLFEDRLDFRFVYDEELKQEVVRNQRPQQGELARYVPTAKGWETGQAFAIVAFVGNPSQSGQVLLLAGTNAEGTEAAGKLVTNLDLLSRTLAR